MNNALDDKINVYEKSLPTLYQFFNSVLSEILKMKFDWKRPSFDDAGPLIYSVFEMDEDTFGSASHQIYRIEDLHEDRFDEAIELLKSIFLVEDPMMSSKNVIDDECSVNEIVDYWRSILDQKISLACFKDGSNEIIGIYLLSTVTEQEFDFKPVGEAWSEIRRVYRFMKDIFFNPFEHYGVERILTSGGCYVNANYQHCGIETEFIKAISDVGKLFEIRVSVDIHTTNIWQKVAVENSYDEQFSISFRKLPKLVAEGYFPGIREENLKMFCRKFY